MSHTIPPYGNKKDQNLICDCNSRPIIISLLLEFERLSHPFFLAALCLTPQGLSSVSRRTNTRKSTIWLGIETKFPLTQWNYLCPLHDSVLHFNKLSIIPLTLNKKSRFDAVLSRNRWHRTDSDFIHGSYSCSIEVKYFASDHKIDLKCDCSVHSQFIDCGIGTSLQFRVFKSTTVRLSLEISIWVRILNF